VQNVVILNIIYKKKNDTLHWISETINAELEPDGSFNPEKFDIVNANHQIENICKYIELEKEESRQIVEPSPEVVNLLKKEKLSKYNYRNFSSEISELNVQTKLLKTLNNNDIEATKQLINQRINSIVLSLKKISYNPRVKKIITL